MVHTAVATGRALLDPYTILPQTGLASGMRVADFGCGSTGHFAFAAALMVGEKGHVYAVDILKQALAGIESRARLEQMQNVTPVWGDIEREFGVRIPPHSLHLILMSNVARLIKKSQATLTEVKRLLRPDGRLLVIDWKEAAPVFGALKEKRVSPDEIRVSVLAAGFRLAQSFEAGPYHWGLLFQRG